MKRRRVWTATDDIRVAPVVCIAQLKRVSHHRIDFIFPLSSAGRCPRALVSFDADVDRMLERLQLHLRLRQTHLSEDGPNVLDAETRGGPGPVGSEALLL